MNILLYHYQYFLLDITLIMLKDSNPNINTNTRKQKSCMRYPNPESINTKHVQYTLDTNFDMKSPPTCKTDYALQQAELIAKTPQEYERLRQDIITKSPMYPSTVSPSAPSSSDIYEPIYGYHYSPPTTLSLHAEKNVTATTKKKMRKDNYINTLESRIKELEQDRNQLLNAYQTLAEQLYYEHEIRIHAEAKAESLGLRLRLSKAELSSNQQQMEHVVNKFQEQLDTAYKSFQQQKQTKDTTLKVQNPDIYHIHMSDLDSDYSAKINHSTVSSIT